MIAPDGESNIIPHHHSMTFVTLTLHINEGNGSRKPDIYACIANGRPIAEEKLEV